MQTTLAPMQFRSGSGERSFPGAGPSILVFLKEDCPTCRTVLPLLDQLARAFTGIDWFIAGQTEAGNRRLTEDYKPTFEILDDSGLTASFQADIDTVPTLFFTDAAGRVLTRLVGFERSEWQALVLNLAERTALPEPALDWEALPAWRPGCGSLSVDPLHAERLAAAASNSPLRARRVEIAEQDDPFEFMFDQGFSDGLPLIPPTPERVLRMLAGSHRDPQEEVAVVPPNLVPATVEKVAINAVMAGARPEYLPVILTALEAACTDEFNAHGVMATTMGASPVVLVNGPIRQRLGMNMGMGALGQGNRANATIGRALRLVLRNVGGARPGGTERSTLGNPMKYTMCFAEWEERNPWTPYHVEQGFAPEDSVVTLFAASSGPVLMVDQDSRTAAQLGGSFGLALDAVFHPKAHYATNVLVVVCPEHVDTFARDGYSKADIRDRIQEVTARAIEDLAADERSGVGFKESALARMDADARRKRLPKFRSPDDIHLVVAGGDAGKFSGAFHGWATGTIGSMPVSRKIDQPG